MHPTEQLRMVSHPIGSLLRPRREYENPEVAKAARLNANAEPKPPFNCERTMLDDLIMAISSTNKKATFEPELYWRRDKDYEPLPVFAVTIEFADCHRGPIPETTLPPEKDVQVYIDRVLSSREKLTVPKQMAILLELSQGNVVGAANIGFWGSRLLARGWDTRAFPGIKITPETVLESVNHLAPFETRNTEHTDSPGDTYYFWTHFYATLAYHRLGDATSKFLDGLFSVGTPAMRFVRKYLALQPTVSRHEEASIMGRKMGIAFSNFSD
jgi:hypothetical protein